MKIHLSLIAAILLPGSLFGQVGFSKINSLPVRNSPQNTDSIPAQDASDVTWRIPFSKFAAGTGTLPDQSGNANKILTTNGTIASWTATPTISLVNATALPIGSITGFVTGAAAFLGTAASSANLRTMVTDEVGTGALYFVGGALGTPASVNLTNGSALPAATALTGLVPQANLGTGSGGAGLKFLADDQTYKTIAGGGDALTSVGLGQFASTPSATFATVISDETGTGAVVLAGSPSFTGSPILGTSPTATRFSFTGTAGSGYYEAIAQSSAPTAPSSGRFRLYANSTGLFSLINSGGFVMTLDGSGLTASRSYALPDKAGTFLVGDDTALSSGTALAVGKHYYDTLSANRTLTFTGTPVAGGNSTILRALVTAPMTLTFPASVRVGAADPTPITSLALTAGEQVLSWTYSNGAWQLIDTMGDTSGFVPSTRTVAGHALSSDVDISDDDLLFSDVTTNNATTGNHGFLKKLDGNAAHFLDGTGNYTTPTGTSIPTGTGFYHITSGAADSAAVAETGGSGAVVRSTLPTIAGILNTGALGLSGVVSVSVSGDINDWAPTGGTTSFSIRADASTTNRTITGIASPAAGRTILITNVSSTANITLADQNTGSSSNNRFDFGGSNFIISPSKTALLRYDITSTRWRAIGGQSLAGDAIAPGNFKFYGTNGSGVKGYQDLAPDTLNLLVGDGSGGIADSGLDTTTVVTSSNIGTILDPYSIPLHFLDFTDIDLSTVLVGSTYTIAPGKNYYGDITGNVTFAFSPAFSSSDAPTSVRAHVTGTGTWTVPTLIREGSTGSVTSVAVGSTGYFTASFLKTGAGNIRMVDTIPQPITGSDFDTTLITGLPADTSPDGTLDYLMTYDDSATALKKVTLGNAVAATTVTLTNKRITKRIGTTTSSATPSINSDLYDEYTITALAANITSLTITGTPTEGQSLILRIKDNGSPFTIAFGTGSQVASTDLPFPTTTDAGKYLYCTFIYNSTLTKWVMTGKLSNI